MAAGSSNIPDAVPAAVIIPGSNSDNLPQLRRENLALPATSNPRAPRDPLRVLTVSLLTLIFLQSCSAPDEASPAGNDMNDAGLSAATGGLANECVNRKPGWIWCDDFDQNRLGSYFEYSAAGTSFLRTASVGSQASYGMKATFKAGQVSAGSLHLAFGRTPQAYFKPVDAGTANYREIYWRYYVRYQSGWSGGGGNKMSRATSFVSASSWAQSMIAHVWSAGQSQQYLASDPASGTSTSGTVLTTTYNDFPHLRWLGMARGTNPLFSSTNVGKWYCVESHVRWNDAGSANGIFETWIDGTLDSRRTGLNWVGSYANYGMNAVYLENYWNNGSPKQQSRYFDNFIVSTTKIGC